MLIRIQSAIDQDTYNDLQSIMKETESENISQCVRRILKEYIKDYKRVKYEF